MGDSLGQKHFGMQLSTTRGREPGELVRISESSQPTATTSTDSEPITDPAILLMYEKKKPTGLPADSTVG
jgi:hypothetical protein